MQHDADEQGKDRMLRDILSEDKSASIAEYLLAQHEGWVGDIKRARKELEVKDELLNTQNEKIVQLHRRNMKYAYIVLEVTTELKECECLRADLSAENKRLKARIDKLEKELEEDIPLDGLPVVPAANSVQGVVFLHESAEETRKRLGQPRTSQAQQDANLEHNLAAPLPDVIGDVFDIIVEYLKNNDYDGLFNADACCSCESEDLAPCCNLGVDCRPGYKVKCFCGEGCDFDIADTRDEEEE